MTEGNYRCAIYDALTGEYESLLPDVKEEHTFSPGFEKRMKKLVKRRDRPYYRMINTAAKRVACIIGILLIASFSTIMSVSALREAFKDFFINILERFSIVRTAENENVPSSVEDLYEITDGLDGYIIIYSEQDSISNNIIYQNDQNNTIDFSQYVKSEFDIAVNTEGADIAAIEINDKEAMFYEDNNGYKNILWDNGDYIIIISSDIGKDILIEIAKSVQKVER